MIWEVRTRYQAAFAARVEKRYGEMYEKRRKYSELAAFWHTELGESDQGRRAG